MKLFLTLLLFTCQAHAGTYFNVPNSTSDITTMTVSGKIGVAASSRTYTTNTILLNGVDGTIYSGNIGIGIAVPVNRLYVNSPYSDSTETVIKAVHRSAGNKVGAALELGSIASIVKIIAYNNPSNDSTSQMEIQTRDSGGVMRTGIYQNENGNVGISTNNPVAKLDVYGDTVFSNANSTVTVSGFMSLPTRDKIVLGNELANSSSTAMLNTYSVVQATFLNCIDVSTITITTTHTSRFLVTFTASATNSTTGPSYAGFKINGVTYYDAFADTHSPAPGAHMSMNFTTITDYYPAGDYNFCAAFASDTGSMSMTPRHPTFAVMEIR